MVLQSMVYLSDQMNLIYGIGIMIRSGSKKTNTVISLSDQCIYFMQRSGFTNFGYNHLKTYEEKIQRFKELGADYLIINDTTLLKDEGIRKFTQYKIGQYKNVVIFKL